MKVSKLIENLEKNDSYTIRISIDTTEEPISISRMQDLANAIQNNTFAKEIEIDVVNTPNISLENFKLLMTGFTNNTSVEDVHLSSFAHINKLADDKLEVLSKCLGMKSSLKAIHISRNL
ncbi:MAG: hypothetical protein HOI53_06900 [Francisellaceae bacterium]|nr:hypothetical protein [Francisellaceae bacterium]MBT6539692.1 hypothetical protein [Francisellaceae bacterium]